MTTSSTAETTDAARQVDALRARANEALDRRLPRAGIQPTRLHDAMRYAVLNGGKRIRSILVYAAGRAAGVCGPALDAPACAVELIHAYSLAHDDLPAMDDDDLRRGKPTCHRAYDEATALLAGDALQSLAFQVLASDPELRVAPARRVEMVATLARASGSRGMAGGQAIDLASVGCNLGLAELENMHIHKTGALIRASVRLGALTAECLAEEPLGKLDHYAKCVGLAFQIQDDVLDVEGDTDVIGKRQGADQALNKPTYPALIGLAESKRRAADLHAQAVESLRDLDAGADVLRWLADYIVQRKH